MIDLNEITVIGDVFWQSIKRNNWSTNLAGMHDIGSCWILMNLSSPFWLCFFKFYRRFKAFFGNSWCKDMPGGFEPRATYFCSNHAGFSPNLLKKSIAARKSFGHSWLGIRGRRSISLNNNDICKCQSILLKGFSNHSSLSSILN